MSGTVTGSGAGELVEVLAAHEGWSFDMATPREYTPRGGWLVSCTCGADLGEHSDDDHEERHREHLADVLRAHTEAAVAAALEGAAAKLDEWSEAAQELWAEAAYDMAARIVRAQVPTTGGDS